MFEVSKETILRKKIKTLEERLYLAEEIIKETENADQTKDLLSFDKIRRLIADFRKKYAQ